MPTNDDKPTVKQHLAAIRMLFDWLVTGQVVPINPAHAVRGPKLVVRRGKTAVLSADQARQLLDSIETTTLIGLRDRALIGLMCYTFARVGAAVTMRIEDYYQSGRRSWVRLHEKGGKRHDLPCHHNLDEYLDVYIQTARIAGDKKAPLFQTVNRKRELTGLPMSRYDVFYMIKRRARRAGLPATTCCHTFRATGITAYLENGRHGGERSSHRRPREPPYHQALRPHLRPDHPRRGGADCDLTIRS